jgi:hypothetical protein
VQVLASFVNSYEDYSCFGEFSFFRRVEGFKIERRAAVKFSLKLNTFEMLKNVNGEECLSRTSVSIS